MPFVTPDALRPLLRAARPPATVAFGGDRLQPLLGVYWPAALTTMRAAAADAPLTRTVESLRPALVDLPSAILRSIDTPEALAEAERELTR
jgi:molybdopterin-guanine dinucleotide biosynthesis protein A